MYTKRTYDVIIVGAGIAAVSIASTLSRQSGKSVLIVDAGSEERKKKLERKMLSGQVSKGSLRHSKLFKYRNLGIGGTSNTWGGGLVPFDPREFSALNERGELYWPVNFSHQLIKRQEEALALAGISIEDYQEFVRDRSRNNEIFSEQITKHNVFFRQSGPKKYSFMNEELITVMSDTVIKRVLSDEHGHCTLVAEDLNENSEIFLDANQIVLAMGTLETIRLLLNSEKTMSQVLGQQSVGHYYSGHITGVFGIVDGGKISEDVALRDSKWGKTLLSREFYSWREFKGLSNQIKVTLPLARDAIFDTPLRSKRLLSHLKPKSGYLNVDAGHVPSRESFVGLSEKKDFLDNKKLRVNFHLSKENLDDFYDTLREFQSQFKEIGGEVIVCTRKELPKLIQVKSHHLGGLRISRNENFGVVDEHLKMHGTKNLFICSAGVFPTFSYANPSLTVSTLGLRLGSHLANAFD